MLGIFLISQHNATGVIIFPSVFLHKNNQIERKTETPKNQKIIFYFYIQSSFLFSHLTKIKANKKKIKQNWKNKKNILYIFF